MRRFFRTTYYLGVVILFLAVAAIGFTQTQVFRSYIRGLILEAAAEGLNGELTLGKLQGNLLTGFRVDTVAIRESGEEVVHIERLEARYDLLSLLAKHLSLSRVTLVNPSIRVARSSGGSWNVGRLIKPTPADTVPSSWVIDLRQLELKTGRIVVLDSVKLARQSADSTFTFLEDQFNYAAINLDSVDLETSVMVRSGVVIAAVRSLSFTSTNAAFVLHRLSGSFKLTRSEVSIEDLQIETGKSKLQADASMLQVDLADIGSASELKDSPLSLRLRAQNVDFGELKQFIGSAIGFLDKGVACDVSAEGTLSALEVKNVTLRTSSSVVRTSGMLRNLHRPRDLELDLAFNNNTIDPVDIASRLPGLSLPKMMSAGPAECDLSFKGAPLAFHARLVAHSDGGQVTVDGRLDARGPELSYEGTVTTANLDLARWLGDSAWTSRVNAVVSVDGSGTSPANLVTLVRAEIDSSEFYGLRVGRSVIVIDFADQMLRSRVAAHMSATRLDLSSTMRFLPQKPVSYEVEGRVNSLNLAEVTKRREQASDLTFDLRAQGSGLDLRAMRGDATVRFFRSSYDTVRFEGGGFDVSLNTMDRVRQSFRFTSDAADLEVDGRFTPASLAVALGQGVTLLSEAVMHRIHSLDSLRGFSPRQVPASEFRSTVTRPTENVSAQVTVHVRDASPLGVILRKRIAGAFTMNGTLASGVSGIEFRGTVDVPELSYADSDADLAMKQAEFHYTITGLDRTTVVDSLAASLNVAARAFRLGRLQTANLRVDLTARGDSGRYSFSALVDSLANVEVQGTSSADSGLITLNFQTLKVDFSEYAYENIEPVRVLVGRDGLHITNLWLRHEVEEVSAAGYLNPGGVSDLTVGIRNFLLSNLPRLYRGPGFEGPGAVFGGIVNAAGTFKGSFDHPNFSVELNATGVRYQQAVFGQILIRSSYFERMLTIYTQFRSHPDDLSVQPDLLMTGTVPYNLSLRSSSDVKLEGEMNLDVRANNFRLEFLDPFLAPLSNMSGLLICDMKLRGTVESPSYEGSVTLQKARFLFVPLGIQYVVDGKLVPNGRRIELHDLTVSNIPLDRQDGKMTLAGHLTLEGIEIRNFNLAANGQLLIMKESSRRAGDVVYGDLFVASGPEGIQWKGTPSQSLVSGTLFGRYVNLTLPPTVQAQELPRTRIPVTLVQDLPDEAEGGHRPTDAKGGRSERSSLFRNEADPPGEVHRTGPSQRSSERSFLDNIDFDLLIQTQGVTQVRFVFTNLTNEELFAVLQGRVTFTKDHESKRLTGEVELGGGSYYNNIKRLEASGKLRFTGSLFNPELDVLARYEGIYRGIRDTASASLASRAGSATSADARGLEQKVVVKLYITGTREQPKVKTELERYDQFGSLIQGTRGDDEADALAFLITGSFRDELTQQDRLSLASTSVLGGLTSSVLSGPLTDLLRKEFGIIRSVDVLYYGGSFQESADVRVTGELGDAVFRLGGRVLNDINNTNVSIQLPMSALLGSEKWRNLILEAERRVEGVETIDQRRESKGVRLLYRIIF